MRRPEAVLEPSLGRPREAHRGREPRRVHFGRGRDEGEVGARLGEAREVGLLGAGIAGQVLAGRELRRVDEDRDKDAVGLPPRAVDEGDVPVMQGAHRRDQGNGLFQRTQPGRRFAKRRYRPNHPDPHRGPPFARRHTGRARADRAPPCAGTPRGQLSARGEPCARRPSRPIPPIPAPRSRPRPSTTRCRTFLPRSRRRVRRPPVARAASSSRSMPR